MSPFAELLRGPWEPGLALLIWFVHGWVLWFVLGQEFLKTVFMATAARAVIGIGVFGLLASGALGRADPAWLPAAHSWWVAGGAAWLLCWWLEISILGILMRRMQSGWRWKAYDLVVLGAAQAAYLAGGRILA